MSVTHAEFTLERHYPQTPAQTFSAFADPELRRRWFVRPGFEWELDFRVGGTERSERHDPHRLFRARFHDIVEAERIVYTYDLEHDHRLISISLATIQFSAEAAGTLLRFTEQGVFFDGPHAAAEREHGTDKLLLAALDQLFASEPVR